jgi:hypothetical protein
VLAPTNTIFTANLPPSTKMDRSILVVERSATVNRNVPFPRGINPVTAFKPLLQFDFIVAGRLCGWGRRSRTQAASAKRRRMIENVQNQRSYKQATPPGQLTAARQIRPKTDSLPTRASD